MAQVFFKSRWQRPWFIRTNRVFVAAGQTFSLKPRIQQFPRSIWWLWFELSLLPTQEEINIAERAVVESPRPMTAPSPTFSPAPWVVESSPSKTSTMIFGSAVAGEHPRLVVCQVAFRNAEANARLIARAPEMFALLETISNNAWEVPQGVGRKIDDLINKVLGQ